MLLFTGLLIVICVAVDIFLTGFYPLQLLFMAAGLLLSLYGSGIIKGSNNVVVKKILGILLLLAVLVCFYAASIFFFPRGEVLADRQIEKAKELSGKKDYVKAFEKLNEIYSKDIGNLKISNALAELYMEQGRNEEAINILNATIAEYPLDEDTRNNIMRCFAAIKNWSAVKDNAKIIISMNPHSDRAYEVLGDMYWEGGDMTRGILYYKTAVRENPELVSAHIKLGDALRKTHSYGEALNELKKSEELALNESDKATISSKLKELRKEIDENAVKRQAEEVKVEEEKEGGVENETN